MKCVITQLKYCTGYNIHCYHSRCRIVVNMPHHIAFGMHHVVCTGIPHDNVVWLLITWYAFSNHILLQFRSFKCQKWLKLWHKKKTKFVWYMGHTPLIGSPAASHSIFGLMWHCLTPSTCSMSPQITQSFGFLLWADDGDSHVIYVPVNVNPLPPGYPK